MSEMNEVPYFISIGFPGNAGGLLLTRAMVYVDLQHQTVTQAAKSLRKNIAKEVRNPSRPAIFFWVVYDKADSGYPFLHSANTPDYALEKAEVKKKHKKDPTAVYLTDQAVQTLQPELGPSIIEKALKRGFHSAGKSLLGSELVEKGLATRAQTNKVGGYQVKTITIDEWKESEQVSEFIKNDLKKNMIDRFETKVKNAGFDGVGITPTDDLSKTIEELISSFHMEN